MHLLTESLKIHRVPFSPCPILLFPSFGASMFLFCSLLNYKDPSMREVIAAPTEIVRAYDDVFRRAVRADQDLRQHGGDGQPTEPVAVRADDEASPGQIQE